MKKESFARRAILAAFSTTVVLALAPMSGAWAADAAKDQAPSWMQHRQEWAQAKLERDANRLEIKASQQAAWGEYANARKALADWKFTRLPDDADAVAIAKHRAERATEAAQKLTALADATAKLQAVLSPEQRQTLDQIVRHGHCGHEHGQRGEHGMHGMNGMSGMHGMRGMQGMQGMDEGSFGPDGGCDMNQPMGMGQRPGAGTKGPKAQANVPPAKK